MLLLEIDKKAVENGLPVYAECGGLMYLGESLILEGKTYPMAGIFPVKFSIGEKPQAHGYSIVEVKSANPYYKKAAVIMGMNFIIHGLLILRQQKSSERKISILPLR